MRMEGLAAIMALLMAVAAPGSKAHPPVAIGSVGEWFGADAYPPQAVRANEEGRVGARLSVDAMGKPLSCTVATSSGSFALDSATCDIAMAHLLFTPATDDTGQPIAGVFPMAIRWVLPKDVTARPLPITFAGRGNTITCTVMDDGISRRLKPEACRAVVKALAAQGSHLDQVHSFPVTRGQLEAPPTP